MSEPAPPRRSLLSEARLGVRGVFALLAFRKNWRAYFDPSAAGALRSFIGVVLAFPAFWFMISAANHFIAENPGAGEAADPVTVAERLLIWVRFWVLFPVTAWIVCALMDLRGGFYAWLTVHNWTVFVLVHIQALIWALHLAGLGDPESLGALLTLYALARLFVHWRVAQGSLGLPPGLSAAAAGVPLIADLVVASALI
ncbi:MAG: hypothetical protein ACFE0P_10065 [Oceanicaulis sp.]